MNKRKSFNIQFHYGEKPLVNVIDDIAKEVIQQTVYDYNNGFKKGKKNIAQGQVFNKTSPVAEDVA